MFSHRIRLLELEVQELTDFLRVGHKPQARREARAVYRRDIIFVRLYFREQFICVRREGREKYRRKQRGGKFVKFRA